MEEKEYNYGDIELRNKVLDEFKKWLDDVCIVHPYDKKNRQINIIEFKKECRKWTGKQKGN